MSLSAPSSDDILLDFDSLRPEFASESCHISLFNHQAKVIDILGVVAPPSLDDMVKMGNFHEGVALSSLPSVGGRPRDGTRLFQGVACS